MVELSREKLTLSQGGEEGDRERPREGARESLEELQKTCPFRPGRREISTEAEKMQPCLSLWRRRMLSEASWTTVSTAVTSG